MAVTALGGAAVSSRLLPSTIKAIASLSISSTSTSSYSLKFLRSSPLISHLFLGQEVGGPKVPMKCGRMVVLGPEPCLEEGRLPDAGPPSPADHRQDVFYRMGLNDKEIVALSGVQTLGRSRPKHSYWGKPETKYTVLVQEPAAVGRLFANEIIPFNGHRWIHSAPCLTMADNVVDPTKPPEQNAVVNASRNGKVKRKKLERKRAVVRWLRSFRWKKKREYQRLTTEEKILYKLNKAKKKEEKLVQALKKIEPTVPSELIHDPEILTPEEHFFFLKMGLKCSNYVPIGRRGIFKGVILNMHLHWKEHQTLRVVVKTFPPEEVKEIASELARLTGGIVLDIHEENTIIMYRGKNYVQPPMEIMSPRITLPRKKALYKSKCRDGLRAVRQYIPKLEQDLKFLRQANSKPESKTLAIDGAHTDIENQESILHLQCENSEMQKEIMDRSKEYSEDDVVKERGFYSDSEDLSDMFESDSEMENEKVERPLHLEEFEKFTVKGNGRAEDFEDHLRQISLDSKDANSFSEDIDMSKFDEVDRLFVRTAALLKKRRGS